MSKLFNTLFWAAVLCGCILACTGTGCTQEKRDAVSEAMTTPKPELRDRTPGEVLQQDIPKVATNPLDFGSWLQIAGAITGGLIVPVVATKKGRKLARAGINKIRRKKPDEPPPLPPL